MLNVRDSWEVIRERDGENSEKHGCGVGLEKSWLEWEEL